MVVIFMSYKINLFLPQNHEDILCYYLLEGFIVLPFTSGSILSLPGGGFCWEHRVAEVLRFAGPFRNARTALQQKRLLFSLQHSSTPPSPISLSPFKQGEQHYSSNKPQHY